MYTTKISDDITIGFHGAFGTYDRAKRKRKQKQNKNIMKASLFDKVM